MIDIELSLVLLGVMVGVSLVFGRVCYVVIMFDLVLGNLVGS